MKKSKLLVVLMFFVLFLDYAALDDITTGNEPNNVGEYLTLIISIPIFYLLIKRIRNKQR